MQLSLSCPVIAVAALGGLVACGGGGEPSFDAKAAIARTGSAAPAETVEQQEARSAGIVARANGVVISTLYIEAEGAEVLVATECGGTRCVLADPVTGFSWSLTTEDVLASAPVTDGETRHAVLTKHGVTLVASEIENPGVRGRTYGAWLEHGAFAASVVTETEAALDTGCGTDGNCEEIFASSFAFAGGELTGSRPPASATWRGVMVGSPVRGNNRDNLLQGDATLTYDMASRTLDADFTGIVDLDRDAAHAVGAFGFDNVPVADNGTFDFGVVGNLIQGGFGGPGHEEAAGILEKMGIVAAFGAKRAAGNGK